MLYETLLQILVTIECNAVFFENNYDLPGNSIGFIEKNRFILLDHCSHEYSSFLICNNSKYLISFDLYVSSEA